MATLSVLVPKHVFGFRGDVKDNLHYVDDGSIVYAAGHSVVIYHPDTRSQKFIPASNDSECITAITVSPNKKLLAVAEKADKAIISIYDLQSQKRRKLLVSVETGSKEFVSLSFSPDGKMLVSQGGAPEWNLILWVWEKSKVAASVRTTNQHGSPVYQCNFHNTDSGLISVVGQNILKVFRVADNAIKAQPSPFTKKEPQNFPCQCWLPDSQDRERLLLGTDSGEIILIEGSEVKATLNTDNGLGVESLVAYSKGFVAGQESGVVTIFEKDDKDGFRRARTFSIENQLQKIMNMAVSMTDEQLCCSLENNQAYTLQLSNTEIMKADEMNFEVMGCQNHWQPITGMDVCVRKPLVATCSTDRTVRLWNWMEGSCELLKSFPEEIYSVAIHPSGLMLLVGFADKLRLMTVLMDDLRTVKEIGIKACREAQFSNGGQYFAAVNSTIISIYSTYTCENIGNLRGHNGKVRSIYWSPDDSKIVTAGMDGAVYEWRLKDFKREKENVLKGCNYTCVTSTPDSKSIYAVGSDKKLKELEESPGSGTQITKEFDTTVVLTQIALPATTKLMFSATETGAVRVYKWPLTGEYHEYKCHAGPIMRMKVANEDTVLFTASEDGSMFVYDIRDKDAAKSAAKREQEKLPFAEEVLITKSELEEKKTRMAELEQQVNELTMQTEYQLRLKDLHMQERLKELSEKFSVELDADKQKFDLLLQEKNEMEMEYEEKLKQSDERGQAQLNALDAQYQVKIMAEVERYQTLMQEKELLNQRWDEQNSLLVESHERVIAELTEEYEGKLAEEALRIEALAQEKEELAREFEEIKRQMEEDADREIEELKEKYEQKLLAEREQSLRLKGENGIMRKKFAALQKDIEAQKEEIKNLFEQKKALYQTISSLEKDITSLRREIRERDDTIGDKERRIYDLKKKNQELEKFKFVLDFKIKELKKQIEPKEEEIEKMKEQIMEMDGELERYHKTNANLDLHIQNLKLKENGLQKEVLSQRSAKGSAMSNLQRFQFDLQDMMQHIQDPKTLKEKVKGLYHKHCVEEVAVESVEADVQREAARQREYLERTVEGLKRKLAQDSELHRADNLRIMQENVALIKEINELRREMRNNKQKEVSKATAARPSSSQARPPSADGEVRKELDMQRDLIVRLREDINTKSTRIKQLEAMVMPRPISRERLPPMDGFKAEEELEGAA